MKSLHLFAGIGGGIIGDILAGNEIVGAVEIDPFCQDVLRARQADGSRPPFPILGDIRDVKGDEFGTIELVCGGFPCQDISLAALNERKGLRGGKSGLFYELVRVVDVCAPACVFLENVPNIVRNGLAEVLQTFAERGFDAEWTIISARDCGAPHTRRRWWGLFYRKSRLSDSLRAGRRPRRDVEDEAKKKGVQSGFLRALLSESANGSREYNDQRDYRETQAGFSVSSNNWLCEPDVCRVVNGVPQKLDKARLRALGNAQVPICAYLAFEVLLARALEEF